MKIKSLKELDVGVANLKIEGDVTYANPPRNVKGTNKQTGKPYNFWSQFVRIEDDTDGIGCSISTHKETVGLEEGDHVTVIMGKLAEYTSKDGEVQQILNGKVLKNKEEKKEATREKDNVQGDTKIWIARECAIKAAVELIGLKEIKYGDFFPCAQRIVGYISGEYHKKATEVKVKEEPADQEGEHDFSELIAKEKKLEIREGHEDDKIIDDKDLPGSSYDNPIPRKKKISKTEDFIQEAIPE